MLTRTDLVPSLQLAVAAASPPGLDLATWPHGYGPVLSLAVVRERDGIDEILVGIRDPSVNDTHPDVVSVPTQRISDEMAGLLYRPLARDSGDRRTVDGRFRSESLNHMVLAVFTNKLGAEDGRLSVTQVSATLRRVDFGESLIGVRDDQPTTEALGMLGVEVRIDGRFEVPRSTRSYSHLLWLPLDEFVILGVNRDATALPIGLKAADVCVHGLCMHSAVEIVRAANERAEGAYDLVPLPA